jgi:hypothetical protein
MSFEVEGQKALELEETESFELKRKRALKLRDKKL